MRPRLLAAWFLLTTSLGTLLFLYKYLAPLTENEKVDVADPLITEFTGAYSAGLLFFALLLFMIRFPLFDREGRFAGRRLPAYVLALLLYAVLHTSMMWASREVLFPLAGLGNYDYGRMPLRYLMEFPVQLVGFCVMVGVVHASWRMEEARKRRLRATELEASLARAQLQNLRLQLQPHFLFNALNTISSVMYADPAAADEMIDRLSELLRVSLRTTQTDEVLLGEELDTLDAYLAIMKARFGDRLDVRIDVDDEARAIPVPSMILQPLIENAVRHGNAERLGRGVISVRGRKRAGMLLLEIEDDGPGSVAGISIGLGLTTTKERLRILHGDRHRFEAKNIEGGFRVTIALPDTEGIEDGGSGIVEPSRDTPPTHVFTAPDETSSSSRSVPGSPARETSA